MKKLGLLIVALALVFPSGAGARYLHLNDAQAALESWASDIGTNPSATPCKRLSARRVQCVVRASSVSFGGYNDWDWENEQTARARRACVQIEWEDYCWPTRGTH